MATVSFTPNLERHVECPTQAVEGDSPAGGEYLRSNDPEPLRNFLAAGTLRSAGRGLGLEGFAATTCSACSSTTSSRRWAGSA